MVNALWLLAAFFCCSCGMVWLALSLESHWQQLRREAPLEWQVRLLQIAGALAIVVSLLLCLCVDHVSMAVLVWIMMAAAAAFTVALTLTWRPRLLRPLLAWLPASPR